MSDYRMPINAKGVRFCANEKCRADLEGRAFSAVLCLDCSYQRTKDAARDQQLRKKAERKKAQTT